MRRTVVELRNRWSESKRKVHTIVSGRGRGDRFSAFPLISGDTFRSIADYILENDTDLAALKIMLHENRNLVPTLFCEVSELANLRQISQDVNLSRFTIYIHNGDVISVDLINDIHPKVKRILCVNWLGERRVAEPIPIGIENSKWNMNGKLEDWMDCYPANLSNLLQEERPITCFQSFNVETNSRMRMNVMSIFSGIDGAVTYERRISRESFRSHLRRSKFVISPPGNGPDCHRTWEAMYSGAIPVVLKEAWPFAHLNLPVLAVNQWTEAEGLIRNNSSDLYDQIWESSNSNHMYFMPLLSQPLH